MKNINIKTMNALLAIAQKTLEWHDARAAEAEPRRVVELAYHRFKRKNDIDFVTKHTPEWDQMCEATAGEYAGLAGAERVTYNAKRRLETAIKAYKRMEGAA